MNNSTLLSIINSSSKSILRTAALPKQLKSYSLLLSTKQVTTTPWNKNTLINKNIKPTTTTIPISNIGNTKSNRNMTTMVSRHSSYSDALYDLVQLDYNVIDSYKAAIDKVKNLRCKDLLEEYMLDLQRQVRDLTEVMTQKPGAKVPMGPNKMNTKSKLTIGNLSDDQSVLAAIALKEHDTFDAYFSMCERNDQWLETRPIIERGREEEVKHKKGIEEMQMILKNGSHMNA